MKTKNQTLKQLLDQYQTISALDKINATLGWDQNVNLPAGAGEERASQSALLTELVTEKWQDPKFQQLIKKVEETKLTDTEKAVVRNLKRAGQLYFQVPKEIIIEHSKTTSEAFMAWQTARRNNKFNEFLPHLKKIIKLTQIIADHLGYKKNPYDALLNLYEPDLTTQDCQQIFKNLQPRLTKLLKQIQSSKNYRQFPNNLIDEKNIYSLADQEKLSQYIMKLMDYLPDRGRLDTSTHPFTTTLGQNDVRITTRYNIHDWRESYTSTIHETGHALYELGVNPDYYHTPLEGGVSLGIHESQSRFWENIIGRNPLFLEFLEPIFKTLFNDSLGSVDSQTLALLLNKVNPSYIRVEADEVTYNLHIALRFEIEKDMISGKIQPNDLPEAWKDKMQKYLGITPRNNRIGVLQDVHWSYGSIGYFPTYTLGNLYASQFTAKMATEIDIDHSISNGQLGTILSWLRTNIHQHGGLIYPKQLVQQVTGESLNSEYFLRYLEDKYSKLYQL